VLDFEGPERALIRQGQCGISQSRRRSRPVAVENPESRVRIGTGPVTGKFGTAAGPPFRPRHRSVRSDASGFVGRIRYEAEFELPASASARDRRASATGPYPLSRRREARFGVLAWVRSRFRCFNKEGQLQISATTSTGIALHPKCRRIGAFCRYMRHWTDFDSVKLTGRWALQHWWTIRPQQFVYSSSKSKFRYSRAGSPRNGSMGSSISSTAMAGRRYRRGVSVWTRTDADGRKGNQRASSLLITEFWHCLRRGCAFDRTNASCGKRALTPLAHVDAARRAQISVGCSRRQQYTRMNPIHLALPRATAISRHRGSTATARRDRMESMVCQRRSCWP